MEYKYRGKSVNDSEWVYGTGVTDFLNVYGKDRKGCWLWSDYEWKEVHPESVGMFTGLKDKNGVKIYEGDIVNWKGMCVADYLWHKDDLIHLVGEIEVCYGGGQEWLISDPSECEVIGNTTDNPIRKD